MDGATMSAATASSAFSSAATIDDGAGIGLLGCDAANHALRAL
jgi:hypothetical protein